SPPWRRCAAFSTGNSTKEERMTLHEPHRSRRWARRAAALLLGILAGAGALVWAWNGVAAELFLAPVIRFKHALALQAALAALAAVPLLVARWLIRPGKER
ncbi:MAG TPA: hypothetical protein VF876_00655, partial [Burkholderiales bacterium]